jgi:hypothetical protein
MSLAVCFWQTITEPLTLSAVVVEGKAVGLWAGRTISKFALKSLQVTSGAYDVALPIVDIKASSKESRRHTENC